MKQKFSRINDEMLEALEKYPVLKKCVIKFDEQYDRNAVGLTDLTVYIRKMQLDEPEVFNYTDAEAEDFGGWGHNSRYRHVFEPILNERFADHIWAIIDILDANNTTDESEYDPDNED
jgi:hypothetical protein